MLDTAQSIGMRAYDQAMIIGKEKLRDIVQPPQHPIALQNSTGFEDNSDGGSLYKRSSTRLTSRGEDGIELSALDNKESQ